MGHGGSLQDFQTFTQNAPDSKTDRAIISSVVSLSRSLGLESLAEGIESRIQLEVIRSIGCDPAQGFYLSKPLKEEARKLLEKEKRL